MNRKVADYLLTQHMVLPGDHVICAVSGGKDSMALLHVMRALAPVLGLTVTAAHMDHQLRGAESLRDASFVREYCDAQNIPLTVKRADVAEYAQAHRLGVEESARLLRYEFLLGLDPDAKIATAHTAEDNLETVLMHLIRGSSLHGLSGIPPVRDRIIRPLLTVNRREIGDYLVKHHIPHMEDSTNALDDCLRNRIRHHVLPLLEAENPNLSDSVTHLTQTLRQEDELLDEMAAVALRAAVKDGLLQLSALSEQPKAIQARMLRLFLAPVPELSFRHLEAVTVLCERDAPSARCSLPGGYTLTRVYESLRLLPPDPGTAPLEPITVEPGGTYRFGPWEITCNRGIAPAILPEGTLAFSLEPLTAPLTLRRRTPGDRLTLRGGTKKLSRFLIDQKIPAHTRDTLPVAVLGDTVLGVLPLKTAAFCSPKAGQICLLLTAKRMEDEQ